MQIRPDQSGLILVKLRVIMHPARSTYIERFANMIIREEVDQDDRGNDHTEQNRDDRDSCWTASCSCDFHTMLLSKMVNDVCMNQEHHNLQVALDLITEALL